MNKQKIAILTQPLGHNYGGIIQNYALQKVLKELGHETTTINRDYDNPHSEIKVLVSKIKTWLFRHVLQPKNPMYFDPNKISAYNQQFLAKNINLSPEINSTEALKTYFEKEHFTAVVVGSDQVWRPKYSPNIFNFYLDFLANDTNPRKLAYAASFGTEEWEYSESETKKCSELAQQFDAISVREDSGINLCKEHLNRKDAVLVLDPTLLLNAEDYSQLINQPKKEIGLFTYVLDETPEKLSLINSCANNLNLRISRNQSLYTKSNPKSKNIEDYVKPPLEGWLQGFRDAEFVITDSFHGTVFSILNKTPFLSLVNKERGASRFESILGKLGLQDRLIYDVNNFDESKLKSDINFDAVHLKLNVLKSESINFLKSHL